MFGRNSSAQTETVIAPSNRSVVSLEKNMLFYADKRYQVTQSGSVSLSLPMLFDAHQYPAYSSTGIDPNNPYVVLIENIPAQNAQTGAWVGWTTRHYIPTKFKIEVYDTYQGLNQWVTLADVSNYTGGHYIVRIPSAGTTTTKIRYTFYSTNSPQNLLGISELFYLHSEATKAYDALMVQYTADGKVGIGTSSPQAMLAVNGNILANEIKVKTDITVPDYVFEPDYALPSLSDIADYVNKHKHLPEVPSARDIAAEGLDLAEMNLLLLKKVEELTLHLIEKEKRLKGMEERLGIVEGKVDR